MLELVSWLVASARTTTASVCVPALPPSAETIGISAARIAYLRISPWNRPTTDAEQIVAPRLMTSQTTRVRTVIRIGSLMSPSPAPDSSSDVLAGFLLDDVDDVVDGDHADQPARVVDHRGRDERIFLEAQRDVFLVHVDRDQGLLARHDRR